MAYINTVTCFRFQSNTTIYVFIFIVTWTTYFGQ